MAEIDDKFEVFEGSKFVDAIRNGEINFIASCITPFHAIGVDAAILYLQSKGVKVNGVIITCVRSGRYILEKSHFISSCCKIYRCETAYHYTLMSVIRNLIDSWKSTSWYNNQSFDDTISTLYVVSPWHPNLSNFRYYYPFLKGQCNIRCIVVDEGLSTYIHFSPDDRTFLEKICNRDDNKNLARKMASMTYSWLCERLNLHFEHSTDWINLCTMIDKGRSGLLPNELSLCHYREVLSKHAQKQSEISDLPDLTDAILICPALNYDKDGELPYKQISMIVEAAKYLGLKAYIKPHPRDLDYQKHYGTLGCEFLTGKVAVETLMAANPQIRAIVSDTSTSLVMAKVVFGIKAISILKLIDIEKYDSQCQKYFKAFWYKFSTLVEAPDKFEDIIKMMMTR